MKKEEYIPGFAIIDMGFRLWAITIIMPLLGYVLTCCLAFLCAWGAIAVAGSPIERILMVIAMFFLGLAILAGAKKLLKKLRGKKLREIQEYKEKFPEDSERVIEALPVLKDILKVEMG